mgnify:CR=1 FL=1
MEIEADLLDRLRNIPPSQELVDIRQNQINAIENLMTECSSHLQELKGMKDMRWEDKEDNPGASQAASANPKQRRKSKRKQNNRNNPSPSPSSSPTPPFIDSGNKNTTNNAENFDLNPISLNLFAWLHIMKMDKFHPSNIRHYLSNGFVVASIISRFFPAQLSTHSFDSGISSSSKKNNWGQLTKFFRKWNQGKEVFKKKDIENLCDVKCGMEGNDSGIHILLEVYRFLFKCKLVPKLSEWSKSLHKDHPFHIGKHTNVAAAQSETKNPDKIEEENEEEVGPNERGEGGGGGGGGGGIRCDAMRCDAMRCDAMRCDASEAKTCRHKITV